jgi:glycolate oxidase
MLTTESLPIPDAVILPGSVEELRQIVKICNKYGVKYRAHSTGIWIGAFPMGEDALAIDLRRMDRIVELNEKDGYAVIESYVTCGALHTEAMKKGMSSHITGGGPAFSMLAGATSVAGFGESGITRGMSGRNMLAVEWLLPNGEVLRLGSLGGPEGDWFNGEGPGPSLQGLMRGEIGASGERGIFTRVAVRLYPWSGPKSMKNVGGPPNFDTELWPEGMYVVMRWPDRDYQRECDAIYALCEAEIFDSLIRHSSFSEGGICHSDVEHAKIHESRIFWDHCTNMWSGIIDGKSEKHMDYCRKVLERVERETGGVFFYELEDYKESMRTRPDGEPYDLDVYEIVAENVEQFHLQSLIWRNWHYKVCMMPAHGQYALMPACTSALDTLYKTAQDVGEPIYDKHVKEGNLRDDGDYVLDGTWMQPEEGGHAFHMEMHVRTDRRWPEGNMDGMMLDGIADKYRTGCPDYYLPNEDGIATIGDVFLGVQDILDPDRLTSGFWTGMHELLSRGKYRGRK